MWVMLGLLVERIAFGTWAAMSRNATAENNLRVGSPWHCGGVSICGSKTPSRPQHTDLLVRISAFRKTLHSRPSFGVVFAAHGLSLGRQSLLDSTTEPDMTRPFARHDKKRSDMGTSPSLFRTLFWLSPRRIDLGMDLDMVVGVAS